MKKDWDFINPGGSLDKYSSLLAQQHTKATEMSTNKPKSLNHQILYYYDVLEYLKKKHNYHHNPLSPESNNSYQIFCCEDFISEPDDYDDDLINFAKLINREYENVVLFLFWW